MCGIWGLIAKRTDEIRPALERAMMALQHRGPDDLGTEILSLRSDPDRCIAFGTRRLAVIDLSSGGHQPMYDARSGNWLVYNGEIYNFRKLRRELEHLGHSFLSQSDTEVLLKCYAEWGEDAVHRLQGMFAFAVWNAKTETLFLARDRLGVKPLYYYFAEGKFAFSSEVRALLASGLVPRKLDRQGAASYLEFGAVQGPRTIVQDIMSLKPGHTMTWRLGKWSDRAYWDLGEIASRIPPTVSSEEAVRTTRQLLLNAVSSHLISDVPSGLFLSGGIDSSAILALASEVASGPVDTFSVGFREGEFSEAGQAARVAAAFGSRHHPLTIGSDRLLEQLPHALAAMDQPTIDGINTFMISGAVKQAGIMVALSGLGGDELFAGYSSSRRVPQMARLGGRFDFLRGVVKRIGEGRKRIGTTRTSKMLALVAGVIPWGHPYFLYRALFLPEDLRLLLSQEASQVMAGDETCGYSKLVEAIRGRDPITQVSVLEGATYMANMLLRDTDGMSMAHSVEVRVPLLDQDLWEFVLPLPGKIKLDSQLAKPLLVKGVGARLPREVYSRRKTGFMLPFPVWLRSNLREEVEDELLARSDSDPILNPQGVARAWDSFLRGRISWARPWALFVLKRWMRRHLGESA